MAKTSPSVYLSSRVLLNLHPRSVAFLNNYNGQSRKMITTFSLWQNHDEEEEDEGLFAVYSNRSGTAELGHTTKGILALRGGFPNHSTNCQDFQIIQLTAIDATRQPTMSNQSTKYDLALFSSLKGVVCITLRCCLLWSGTLALWSSCRFLRHSLEKWEIRWKSGQKWSIRAKSEKFARFAPT